MNPIDDMGKNNEGDAGYWILDTGYWVLDARSNMAPFLTQFLEERKLKRRTP